MRGETRVGNFSRKPTQIAYDLLCEFASQTSASPHPSKAFKKGINCTNLVLKNGETPPFSIVKWLLFLLSYVKLFAKPMFSQKTRSSKPLAVYVGFYSKKLAAGGTRPLPDKSKFENNFNYLEILKNGQNNKEKAKLKTTNNQKSQGNICIFDV